MRAEARASYIGRVILDEHDSEDVARETLLRILRSLGGLQQIDRFWPRVFRIAANTIRRHYRCESRL